MKKRKVVSLLTMGVLSLGLLVACGGKSAEDTKDGKIELQIATWANETESKEFDKILDDLNKKSPDYEIKQVVIPQDYYTKVQTMIAGNTAPDLMWLAQEYIPAYAENGAVMDISEQLKDQNKIDMSDYYKGSLDTAIWNDKTYGLPWIGQPYVVYYNKNMLKDNNIAEPTEKWTWDDFGDIAKKLTKKDEGVYGFANTGSLPSAVFAWDNDSDFVSTKGVPEVNSEGTIKGLEQYYHLTSDSQMTMPYEEANSLGVEQGFVTGKIGMMVGGANDDVEKKVKEAGDKFEVGMAIMPAGLKAQKTFNWTASTLISSQTKHKDVAFEALLDITNAMFDWKVPAPVKSKADKIADINPAKAYAMNIIKGSMEISRGFNNLPQQNELGGKQWELLDQPILSNNNGKGNLNVPKVANETQKAFEKILGTK